MIFFMSLLSLVKMTYSQTRDYFISVDSVELSREYTLMMKYIIDDFQTYKNRFNNPVFYIYRVEVPKKLQHQFKDSIFIHISVSNKEIFDDSILDNFNGAVLLDGYLFFVSKEIPKVSFDNKIDISSFF